MDWITLGMRLEHRELKKVQGGLRVSEPTNKRCEVGVGGCW